MTPRERASSSELDTRVVTCDSAGGPDIDEPAFIVAGHPVVTIDVACSHSSHGGGGDISVVLRGVPAVGLRFVSRSGLPAEDVVDPFFLVFF